MILSKYLFVFTIVLLILCIFMCGIVINNSNDLSNNKSFEYVNKIFDDNIVHNISINIQEFYLNDLLLNAEKEIFFPCDIIIDGELFENVAIRAKGNSSLSQVVNSNSNKYSFKIKFDYFNKNNSYYGLKELILNNLVSDNTFIKDYIVFDMMNYMGVVTPKNAYSIIKINNENWGLYLGIESIDDVFLARNYGNNYGFLYKPEPVPGNEINSLNDNGADLVYYGESQKYYSGIFNNSESLISNYDKLRLINSIKKLNEVENGHLILDIEKTIKYFVVHNFVVSFDSYTGPVAHNYYLYENNGIISVLPWDYNLAFGEFSVGKKWFKNTKLDTNNIIVNMPIDNPLVGCNIEERPLWGNIVNNENNLILYHRYFNDFIKNYFESGYFEDKINFIYELLIPVIDNRKEFYSREEFINGIDTLKELSILRSISVKKQLLGEIKIDSLDEQNYIDASSLNLDNLGSLNNFNSKKDILLSKNVKEQINSTEKVTGVSF